MRNNAIHVSDYMVNSVGKTKITRYNQVMYGAKVIRMKKRSKSNGNIIMSNEINLSRMVGNYFMITANKSEYETDKNIIPIDTTSRCDLNDKRDGKYEPSGVAVLCICILNKQKNNTGWAWVSIL